MLHIGSVAAHPGDGHLYLYGCKYRCGSRYGKARGREFRTKTVAILGDSTFVHSGITGLIDVVYNKGNSTVIILDNSITGMTGHQHNPTTGFTIRENPQTGGSCKALQCRWN